MIYVALLFVCDYHLPVCHGCAGTFQGQQRELVSLEMELQVHVGCHVVQRMKSDFSRRTDNTLIPKTMGVYICQLLLVITCVFL